ncbi:FdhF/YdeP family oxidoreductase [Tenacibaculum finnmarkense]|uniref:FdhF/YdeP family oxidoreductase n=1 Tax=Tenacibaculum finnmarkense TaxID=2781243 RepID=UPI001EFA8690|nr:FdhF/YdeP family oxidoreductase [Tenacibaculum finnmarkense]MCG8763132.1 FdhF/YdeP family oxidoreductase [Tenacibaculum finnmarkense]MCG8788509.1 FdhF/YdeP family oxidoreductase [Tenacibaculum finnmarkense]MCG8795965.1 FdhF/YdeP family oxidoreductase [Tenacibaculum finnmarkense]MCG8798397.1 FdhF/YdeP family oxidoreductase [Tenacibaculum finnmarkense]MCG8859473.1 FdhF/YdeP family oxidoreductase [Tenacibaculum finnmarkense]
MSNQKQQEKTVKAQPPENLTGIKLIEVPTKAVGTKAIKSALSHVFSETGIVKGIQLLKNINQLDGFDCPGCAWPDPDQKRAFLAEYCENGAKAIAEEATTNRVSPLFFATHTVQELSEWSDYDIGKSGRITHPMILREGSNNYEEISWENAFKLVGNELNGLKNPDEAIFYTSGRTSNEAAFLYQLFVRKFGTNNLPDCSNMCHESSGSALSQTVGIGKGSVTLDDFNHADLVIVIGQNPGTNHPRMLTALKQTKDNGGKIMTINPLPEVGLMKYVDPQNPLKWLGAGDVLTDLFLQVKINGDVALLKIILKLMKTQEQEKGGVFNHQFIKEKTHGLDDFLIDLDTYTIAELLPQTGLSLEIIEQATQMIINNDKIIICWAMGLTQHKNGVDNIREVVNLLLLKGSIGKKGAGTCPVRGHSNVQGDRTMGIWEKPKDSFLDSLEKEFQFQAPRKHGYDVVAAIEAMYAKKASVFVGMGGNFISATPDTEYTAKALKNCNLTVQISTKLNRSHLIHGKQALILPCLGRSEKDIQKTGDQFITVENSMGVVHQSNGHLSPSSDHLLSEPAIVAGMAKATLKNTKIDWELLVSNYDLIRNKIEATIPGFENYNEKVRVKGGFYLPNNARENNYAPTLTGKANFSTNLPSDVVLEENQFMMMTIRTHDQYNTTIYGLNDRYRGVLNERRVIFMNPEDMRAQGLSKLDKVDLTSHFQGEKRSASGFLVVPYSIPKQCTATYFPEANVLVPLKSKARISHTPASKTVIITLLKHE